MSDFTFDPEHIAQFKTGVSVRRVWASLGNEKHTGNPEAWVFCYEPLFSPETDIEGALNIRSVHVAGRHRLRLAVYVASDMAQQQALEALKLRFPDLADQIRLQNISAIPVRDVAIRIDDLSLLDGVRLVETKFQPRSIFTMQIEYDNADDEGAIRQVIENSTLDYTYTFSAKKRSDNLVTIKNEDIKRSRLYTTLYGPASNDEDHLRAYVHRDDVRDLTRGILSEVKITGIIEDPERFKYDFVETILQRYSDRVTYESDQLDRVKDQTYNADDLKPSTISKALNDAFTKEEDEWHLTTGSSGKLSTKASWGKVFSGELGGEASFSKDELTKKLRDRGIKIAFEGEKIVAKSIDLEQLSVKELTSASDVTSLVSFVSGLVKGEERGSIELWRVSQDRLGVLESGDHEEYWTQEILSFRQEFIGLVGAFPFGEGLPNGWLPCDGSVLRRVEHAALYGRIGDLYGAPSDDEVAAEGGDSVSNWFKLPDYRGQFLRGHQGDRRFIDEQEDSTRMPRAAFTVAGKGTHGHVLRVPANGNDTSRVVTGGTASAAGGMIDMTSSISGDGGHSHTVKGGDPETRPRNMAVRYAIRAK